MQATARPIDSAPVRAASDANSAAAGAGIAASTAGTSVQPEHEDGWRGRSRQPHHPGRDRGQDTEEGGEEEHEDQGRRVASAGCVDEPHGTLLGDRHHEREDGAQHRFPQAGHASLSPGRESSAPASSASRSPRAMR